MRFFISLLVCLGTLSLSAQSSQVIEYSKTGAFTWSLFRGKINPRHLNQMGKNVGAVTVSSIAYETLDNQGNDIRLKVSANFHLHESWTRYPKLYHPDEALNHEKRHFDICEIYARKFRKLILQTNWNRNNFSKKIGDMFEDLATEYRTMEDRYDRETDHSMDDKQQQLWNKKIDNELASLAAYAEDVITVTLN